MNGLNNQQKRNFMIGIRYDRNSIWMTIDNNLQLPIKWKKYDMIKLTDLETLTRLFS